ncbi:Uncharacterised protein [Burkholderia pseudomallei]|nr:Uncharacterised protein [Burkholderia pseudomallei]CAJ3586936.1 Uncharacterised protein [Burkholderia pseudomallei]CAJ5393096.1 Uncharacterised protein [Burkholderia pseudomallei]CAJ9033498.1 Uncharacterised protein [Burkholderia pseudomallei]CAJ9836433.1 Uncharacterised protein [Burkholderia pseudomallei]
MIAWHYTTGQKFELIKQTGILLPADIGVAPPELPILWFSTHPRYEPSAMKPLGDSTGNIVRMLTLDEMRELGGGLYRFSYPISHLKCGENLRKAAKMSSIWWRRLVKGGANLKADPADWWGHVGSLSLSKVTVETMDSNKRWIPVGDRG